MNWLQYFQLKEKQKKYFRIFFIILFVINISKLNDLIEEEPSFFCDQINITCAKSDKEDILSTTLLSNESQVNDTVSISENDTPPNITDQTLESQDDAEPTPELDSDVYGEVSSEIIEDPFAELSAEVIDNPSEEDEETTQAIDDPFTEESTEIIEDPFAELSDEPATETEEAELSSEDAESVTEETEENTETDAETDIEPASEDSVDVSIESATEEAVDTIELANATKLNETAINQTVDKKSKLLSYLWLQCDSDCERLSLPTEISIWKIRLNHGPLIVLRHLGIAYILSWGAYFYFKRKIEPKEKKEEAEKDGKKEEKKGDKKEDKKK